MILGIGADRSVVRSTKHLGPFRLHRLVSSGETTETFLASRAGGEAGSRFLFKQPKVSIAQTGHVDRFQSQLNIASRFDHPSILRTLESGEIDGRPFQTLEYCEGIVLETLLADRSRRKEHPPVEFTLFVISDILSALSHVHNAGGTASEAFVVRDLAPVNVLVAVDGRARLFDFSYAAGPYLCAEPSPWTRFRAPELIVPGRVVDRRADIYSAGALLFELATCRKLVSWTELTPHVTRRMFRNLHPEPSDVDSTLQVLDTIVDRSLQHLPERRYQSAEEMLSDVQGLLQELSPNYSRGQVGDYVRKAMEDLTAQTDTGTPSVIAMQEDITAIPIGYGAG